MIGTSANPIDVAYLLTGVLFIVGLRYLSSPATARTGNRIAMAGMLLAIGATLFAQGLVSWWILAAGGLIGAIIGFASARAVKMTAMPQMVALFNGAGGGAAALVSTAEFLRSASIRDSALMPYDQVFTIMLSAVIGALSFAGSIIAFLKLQELMTGRPITYRGQQFVNGIVALLILAPAIGLIAHRGTLMAVFSPPAATVTVYFVCIAAALLLGMLFVLPIGGADMPVVISLLNSFTGMAAAATGFVLANNVLIISGALVGASGTLLTVLMGKAMNRSLANVLFGAFGAVNSASQAAAGGAAADAHVRSATVEDVATMLAYARQVVVVPGYGMAVAQAQHSVRELADQLEKRGVEVKYAIHPVAGRMPGHMNVLLAEANVPYPALYDMDDINPEFPRTDVALVIGANDVTNPAARNVASSPIYGMPILDVDKAANIVVLKRSMRSGFAGIDNPLYQDAKCVMLFGDAKNSVDGLITAVKTA
ncbi:MAG: NAD(P)(+) transhydrogenase (Re/Si-specific) subunit beta [Candidatus Eremiobacteraeota bacterium]|nr:NAD(P)(+) transhydrogenase (Re/Si-specific) subunit beta [Candidatus Eremiobacteraeota bacterium]